MPQKISLDEAKQLQIKSTEETIIEIEDRTLQANKIREAISQLDKRTQDIIYKRFFAENKTTRQEIAKQYSVSKGRIQQIEAKALRKIEETLKGIPRIKNYMVTDKNNKIIWTGPSTRTHYIPNTDAYHAVKTLQKLKKHQHTQDGYTATLLNPIK